MKPFEVLGQVTDADLSSAVQDALAWRRTGVLPGQALTNIAQALLAAGAVTSAEDLDIAEGEVLREAARRFVEIQQKGGGTPVPKRPGGQNRARPKSILVADAPQPAALPVAATSGINPADVPTEATGSRQDPLYPAARELVIASQRASLSMVQRHLRIPYSHASKLLEAMEGDCVGPIQPDGMRQVLTTP